MAEILPSTIPTYSANIRNFTPAATPTDVIAITGSATKTVKILKVVMSTAQTTAGLNEWFLVKRSTANTSGTPSSATIVPFDSGQPAATATVVSYGANPTTGSPVGNLDVQKVAALAPTGVSNPAYVLYQDATVGAPIVLRGVGDVLALNFGGAAVPAGLVMNVSIFWTETF